MNDKALYNQMPIVVLLGPPGAGKGTQGEYLARKFKWKRISTGDLLRGEVARNTELGKRVYHYLAQGQLVSDEIINEVVSQYVNANFHIGIILDGYPRTIKQAEALENYRDSKPLWVILIEVPEVVVIQRLSLRRVCAVCGKVYNPTISPFPVTQTCKCGGDLVQREDDQPATISHRLEVYRELSSPLIDFYQRRRLLIKVDGTGTPEEVFSSISQEIGKKLEYGAN
ncbi:MAG: adenylate kinase [bacterium]